LGILLASVTNLATSVAPTSLNNKNNTNITIRRAAGEMANASA